TGVIAELSYFGTARLLGFDPGGKLVGRGPELDWPKGFVPWFVSAPGSLVLSADGSTIGRAALGNIFSCTDIGSGGLGDPLNARGIAAVSGAWSNDGRTLVVVSREGEVSFWDTGSWHGRRLKGAPLSAVRGLAFSPDGKMLATACDNRAETPLAGFAG